MEKERDARLENDKDFVLSKKHSNSLRRLIDSYPNGVPDGVISRVLQIPQEDVKSIFNRAISVIKQKIDPNSEK